MYVYMYTYVCIYLCHICPAVSVRLCGGSVRLNCVPCFSVRLRFSPLFSVRLRLPPSDVSD